tara:strand:+ start:552 stop:908 length:357 start_codon:yes stop_codon:yes gene_type:complete
MTLGTWLYTQFMGYKVGEDYLGNTYYKSSKKRSGNREERWVIYAGEKDASNVPAEWHSWLHHTTDEPIAVATASWKKRHHSNPTGTDRAYLPPGHDERGRVRKPATGDYQPWIPDDGE